MPCADRLVRDILEIEVRAFLPLVALLLVLPVCGARAEDLTKLGGEMTSNFTGRNAIQLPAPNVTDQTRFDEQISGFSIFHKVFSKEEGVGPSFVNASCGGCHVNNGRGPIRFTRSFDGNTMVVKVGLRGRQSNGAPRDIPGVGEQLQEHTNSGEVKFGIKLTYQNFIGRYPDGTKYSLRKPKLSFTIPGVAESKIVSSLRMTPAVIGPGLIDAIPEAAILALADPDDADGDGISGKPQYVPNRRTGLKALGRFGFRASNPTTEQQSTGAAFNDMGVTSTLFPETGKDPELSDEELRRLVRYLVLAGVPAATNQSDERVIEGQELFKTIGCDGCHIMTLQTGSSDDPESADQTIHPFTDLLLHNMGIGLADTRAEFEANGNEWRTSALWGLGFSRTISRVKPVYLHDGRARTIEEAILWHGGEAGKSQRSFKRLKKRERESLILFLKSL